jgi:proteasome lid subunit RPN8/RPN11
VISLGPGERAALGREGERAYPNECCGVLLGGIDDSGGKAVESLLPINNKGAPEEQYHRFAITSEDYLAAEKEARRQNRDILGFYHSHPDHPAVPSAFDKDNALPFYSYVIVSVENGKAGVIRSWELTADRGEFKEEEILWR